MFANRSTQTFSPRRTAALVVLLAVSAGACADDENDAVTTTSAPGAVTTTTEAFTPLPVGDLVATALTNHVFTQLAGMVVNAGLVETLRGGPFTVFAPTDDAFGELPLDALHAVEDDPDTLTTVLLHHVVPGTITPDDLVAGELETAAGTTLTITEVDGAFFVDGNPVGAAVEASNGYIYVMSNVLLPG